MFKMDQKPNISPKFDENRPMHPNTSVCIQRHPNASKHVRMHPNVSKSLKCVQKLLQPRENDEKPTKAFAKGGITSRRRSQDPNTQSGHDAGSFHEDNNSSDALLFLTESNFIKKSDLLGRFMITVSLITSSAVRHAYFVALS